jgi:hypothetical protein
MAEKKTEKATAVPEPEEKKVPGEQHHIVANPNGGWDLKRSKGEKVIKHFATKQEAVDYGKVVSKNQDTTFLIHKKDGKIQKK